MSRSALVAAAWAGGRRELAGNPRLRLGLFVIAGILALYLWLLLRDGQAALAQEYRAERQRLARIVSLAGQEHWLARAEAARTLREALEAEIPSADTLGLAQASVQSWARDLGAAAGAEVRVQTEAPARVRSGENLWRIPVNLSGALEPRQVLQLIQRIERQPNLTTIEQALILSRDNRTFSLTVVAFYRIPEEAADAPG